MESYTIQSLANVENLVALAQSSDEPVVVFDGEDECLVAMSPSVLERIMFDTNLLNSEHREALHL